MCNNYDCKNNLIAKQKVKFKNKKTRKEIKDV